MATTAIANTPRPSVAAGFPAAVAFGREVCSDLAAGQSREWLVTNGIGGFACGTVAGVQTRRYHGLLVAALHPPLGRTLLVSKIEETVDYNGASVALGANRWADGSVAPDGFRHIESFRLEGTTPVWTFAAGDALIEKRVWMRHGVNATYVRYSLVRASGPASIAFDLFINYRDYHSTTRGGDWRFDIRPAPNGLEVVAFDGARPFYLLSQSADVEARHDWYRNYDLEAERYRGLDSQEDHLRAARFRADLSPAQSVTLVLSTDPGVTLDGAVAYEEQQAREAALLQRWEAAQAAIAEEAPAWVSQLVLAADQFVVARPIESVPDAKSIIAGYPWFGDWGRDTMIALPGLTLSAGRPEVARRILCTFARFTSRGMLPNLFPDGEQEPEYNTADAALWYFEAVRAYYEVVRDNDFLERIFPLLADMVAWHSSGTRYHIGADPADGLLYAGEPGVQLTWMDAKVGDWVVTPRIGKPVEVNALWYNALCTTARIARIIGKPAENYEAMARFVRAAFTRFWNDAAGYCYDIVDGPEGDDPTLRPNQIFAVSLPDSPLTAEQQRAVVDVCGRRLLASFGLRSLDPADPRYQPRYGGTPWQRDAAYHQGTVWGWLMGPFAIAHLRVYNDPGAAASFLAPVACHLAQHGLGSFSEIFDADPPFTPRGCFAQAWSVAEALRAWTVIATARIPERMKAQG